MSKEQIKAFLIKDPASIPVAGQPAQYEYDPADFESRPGTPAVAGPSRPPPATPPHTQARNKNGMGKQIHLFLSSPSVARRNPADKISVNRVDIPEDIDNSKDAKLIIIFKNLDLKGKGKATADGGDDGDSSESPGSDEDEEDDGENGGSAGNKSGGGPKKNKKKKKKAKGNKKKKGRK